LTGTIDSAGRIGEVGGIFEKSRAAHDSGERMILLPRDNAQSVRYVEVRQQYYGFEVVERQPEVVDAEEYIEENIGIDVEYVEPIDDALRYFKTTTIPTGA
jgi:predicted S18 family serine protease